MAATIEVTTNNYPIFGINATIKLSNAGNDLNWLFQSASVDKDAKRVEIADGIGETKARVWADVSQQKTLNCEVIITGADAAGAATANSLTVGNWYAIACATNSEIAGNWTLDRATPNVSNSGVQSYSLVFRPHLP